MTTDAWESIGNLANMAGLAGFAISGAKSAVAGYQAYASPSTSLTESEKKLERVRSRLQGLSPQRREEIDIAIRSKASNCKSLKDLEKQLQECVLLIGPVSLELKFMAGFTSLMDMHCILSKGYGEVTFAERHFPYTEFRKNVSNLQDDAGALLNDTLVIFLIRLFLLFKSHSPYCASDNNSTMFN